MIELTHTERTTIELLVDEVLLGKISELYAMNELMNYFPACPYLLVEFGKSLEKELSKWNI